MSYKADLELDEEILKDCIYRIQKVSSVNTEYEFFENVNDPEHPEIAQKLSWLNRFENTALVYVWCDELARNNRAQAIHNFTFQFDYSPDENFCIYACAYKKLKELIPNGKDV